MKKFFMLFCLFPLIGLTNEDLIGTFQWGTNTVGVVFQTTNLTQSVKATIRDDAARIMSFNPPSNSTFVAFNTGDMNYGVFTGRIAMTRALVPHDFWLTYYNTYNGTNYFVVDPVACTNYLEKIALTNQFSLATGALEAFVNTLNQVSTNNLSPSALASLYWSLQNDRALTLAVDFENDMDACLKKINSMSAEEHIFLSILDISTESLFGQTWLMAGLRIRRKNDPNQMWGDLPVVFRQGQWRFIPGDEMP